MPVVMLMLMRMLIMLSEPSVRLADAVQYERVRNKVWLTTCPSVNPICGLFSREGKDHGHVHAHALSTWSLQAEEKTTGSHRVKRPPHRPSPSTARHSAGQIHPACTPSHAIWPPSINPTLAGVHVQVLPLIPNGCSAGSSAGSGSGSGSG